VVPDGGTGGSWCLGVRFRLRDPKERSEHLNLECRSRSTFHDLLETTPPSVFDDQPPPGHT